MKLKLILIIFIILLVTIICKFEEINEYNYQEITDISQKTNEYNDKCYGYNTKIDGSVREWMLIRYENN